MTPCEMDSLRARGWKINGKSAAVFSPDCRPDGSYVPEQCDKSKGQCWCVDKREMSLWEQELMEGVHAHLKVGIKSA